MKLKSITIKNFGPIKSIHLNLEEQYNILIGAQATGKSTVVKCIAFFSGIFEYFEESLVKKARGGNVITSEDMILLLHGVIRDNFINSFSDKFLCSETSICCDYGEEMFLNIQFLDKELLTIFSSALENSLREVFEKNSVTRVSDGAGSAYDTISIRTWVEEIKDIFGGEDVIYVPAGRNTLSAMINANVFTREAVGSFDFAVANYLRHVMFCKNRWDSKGKFGLGKSFYNEEYSNLILKNIEKFSKLSGKILKGKYKQKKEEDYIATRGGKSIPVAFASSGQQEVLWIINLLMMVLVEQTKVVIIVEEPEAHLYPDAQFELIKLVALVANSTGSKIFVTTHSPYVLSAFNLFLHSGFVENNAGVKNRLNQKVIDEIFRINPGSLVAHKIADSGNVVNLISDKRYMMDIFAIDDVSVKINDYSDRLINREIRYDL